MIMDSQEKHETDNIDGLIKDFGGCGRFQVVVIFMIHCNKIVASMSMMLMAFANYNTGWQCLDSPNGTDMNRIAGALKDNNISDKCDIYKTCDEVEFTPGIRTVVTEWQLMCDKSWIASLIISIQMVGVLVGAYLAGCLGDRYGRKSCLYAANTYHLVMNIIAIFSHSWQLFAVMRFLIGIATPFMISLPTVLAMEYTTSNWRPAMICMPFWPAGGILMTLSAMATEDWRYFHVISAVVSFICLIPCFWIPESLRWLMIKNKMDKASNIVNNIAYLKRTKECNPDRLQRIASNYIKQACPGDHSFRHLLRAGFRKPTIIFGVLCMSYSAIYYAIIFSMKAMPGSLFRNLLITFALEAAVPIVSSTVPNYIGRRKFAVVFLSLATVCLFSVIGLRVGEGGSVQSVGVLLTVIGARQLVDPVWDITATSVGEFYPTVIRSTSLGYITLVARIGSILAPYLIPDDDDGFVVKYCIMAALTAICTCFLLMIPETKGKSLQEKWEERETQPAVNNTEVGDESVGNDSLAHA